MVIIHRIAEILLLDAQILAGLNGIPGEKPFYDPRVAAKISFTIKRYPLYQRESAVTRRIVNRSGDLMLWGQINLVRKSNISWALASQISPVFSLRLIIEPIKIFAVSIE